MRYGDEYKLCYIERPWAYFTTQELEKQQGDDWNDVPYEYNAGRPYTWKATVYNLEAREIRQNLEPRWEVVKVCFEVNLATPDDEHSNSPYSVKAINKRAVPWLRPYRWDSDFESNDVKIWAGITYPEFVWLIQQAGGNIYEPIATLATASPDQHGVVGGQ